MFIILMKKSRIVFVEIYGQDENIINKEFYVYGDNCIERIYFTNVGRLRNISMLLVEGECIKKELNWGVYGCSESDYVYAGSRLEKILVQQKEHVDPSFNEFEVDFEYNADELMCIVNVFPNGYQEQRYP